MFQQILSPIAGSLALSAVLAATPLLLLFVLLGVFKVRAPVAALSGLALAVLLAVLGWQMPVSQVLSATAEGGLYGVVPILWILVNALWVYQLTVVSGHFETLGRAIRAVSDDQRVLAILIAFCFGALLEALAGFGAPVAISAAMLMAAGLKPIKAAVVSLLANTAPVAFGAMAVPITTLAGVTGLPQDELAAMAGRQTPLLAALVPLLLVSIVDGRRGLRQTWPVALLAGLTFGAAQFVTANFFAVEVTDVVAAVVTIIVVLAVLRLWSPPAVEGAVVDLAAAEAQAQPVHRRVAAGVGGAGASGSLPVDRDETVAAAGAASGPVDPAGSGAPPARETLMAVLPYLVIIVAFAITQVPALKAWLGEHGTWTFGWPGLDAVTRAGTPVSAETFHLDHLRATGTVLLLSGVVTAAVYRIGPAQALGAYRDTVVKLRWTIVTVVSVLALAFVMNTSGQTVSLGVALASAGGLFALLSPLLGWVGVAVTGSDTSSNSLFGLLQVTAARQSGLDPVLMAATNSSAGVLGKMISPQNLAVAAAAIGMPGSEGELFRRLVGWSLGLLVLMTALVYLQSTPVLGWMVP